MKIYIGIDPGQTGAVAFLNEKNDLEIIDYTDPSDVARQVYLWKNKNILFSVLEKVSAMPKQGVSSTFKFGTNFGVWQGILSAFKIPYELVTPQKWQKGLVKKTDGKDAKERSLAVARRFFPSSGYFKRKKDHNRADAALMAIYAKRLK